MLLEAVFKHLDLLEKHFFGLQYVADSPDNLVSQVLTVLSKSNKNELHQNSPIVLTKYHLTFA